ncbi:COX15/CtaA family protein [Natrialbaceae archaeon A-gly3]
MSYDNHTSSSFARSLTDRFGFSHLLVTTAVLVAATILLGVAAKATGAGLACDANWPLCDGGLFNLFPANFPSFFEWIHRVVAGVAGIFIVATAAIAWLSNVDSKVATAVTLGMVLTPIQVYLGRETVLGYDMLVLDFHFWTAIVIFVLFVAATVAVVGSSLTATHVAIALVAGAASIPVHVALSPIFIGTYTPVIQTLQYTATLGLLTVTIIAAMIGFRRVDGLFASGLIVLMPVFAFGVILFGRRAVMTFNPTLETVYVIVSAVLVVTMLVTAFLARRVDGGGNPQSVY